MEEHSYSGTISTDAAGTKWKHHGNTNEIGIFLNSLWGLFHGSAYKNKERERTTIRRPTKGYMGNHIHMKHPPRPHKQRVPPERDGDHDKPEFGQPIKKNLS